MSEGDGSCSPKVGHFRLPGFSCCGFGVRGLRVGLGVRSLRFVVEGFRVQGLGHSKGGVGG